MNKVKKIGAIVGECQAVGAAVDQTVLGGKTIILRIQFPLLFPDLFVAIIFRLVFDQFAHRIPQSDHTFDSPGGRGRRVHSVHPAVFAVIQLAVHKGITEIAHGRIGREGRVFFIRHYFPLKLHPIGMDIGQCFSQQFA